MNKSIHKAAALLFGGVLSLSLLAGCSAAPPASDDAPDSPQPRTDTLVIAGQGVFSAGGITLTSDGTFDPENQWEESGAGQTAHVDHANVLYQIPENETGLPMVFLHGYGQSRVGWMSTPDGREGWSNLFLKKGHSVFLVDQPRRGAAGATSVSGTISTRTLEQRWYTQFRIGRWENGASVVNEGSQFPNDTASVEQFFRQMTPDTGMSSDMGGDFDNETVAKALAAAVDEVYTRTGKKSILVTHSQGGGPGWTAAQYTKNIAAIIAIEPGGAPPADSGAYKAVTGQKIPVTFYFGDYIDNGDPAIAATGMWQGMREACYQFAAAYTAEGGNCTVVDLPKEGITGNDHFIFQDLNNDVVADHVEGWIAANVTSNVETYTESSKTPENSAPQPATVGSKTLVVYFSMPETTRADNLTTDEESSVVVIDGEVLGNTQYLGYLIQKNTGADIFRIEPQTPYPTEHKALVNQAKEEQNKNARPKLSANVENLSQYGTIFVGYPNWWGDMPMILYTFFDENDFSGKTILPFNTHGGSGFSDTIGTIAELEPNATVAEDGFTVSRNTVHDAESDVVSWLDEHGY